MRRAMRFMGSPIYSVERHVEALVALVAEREALAQAERSRPAMADRSQLTLVS